MDKIQQLKEIAKTNGGIISNKAAADSGISRSNLAKLCSDGEIQRITRGQYILCDDIQDELLSIDLRSPNTVFSHETALFLHGISNRTPFEHTITAPSGNIPSKAIKQLCKIYYVKPELFTMGMTKLTTPAGNLVSAYDLERTICDIVRSRSRVGTETLFFALKAYAASSKKELNKLDYYAKKLRVAHVVRGYLEVLI